MIVCVVNATGLPPIVMLLNVPLGPLVGSIACKFLAPLPCVIVNDRVFPLHTIDPNEEEFRPSSQVSICSAETIGIPRVCAEATI